MLSLTQIKPTLSRGQSWFWLIIVLWHVAFFPTFYFLSLEWFHTHEMGHGILVWPYALYLVWKFRDSYVDFGSNPNLLGFGGIFLAGLCWLISSITSIEKAQQLFFFSVFLSVLLALGSWRLLRALMFPLCLMLLSLEIWKLLQMPLRDLSTIATIKFIQVYGLPVLREGYSLSLPGGRFLVEPACSGLSFFMASLLLALILTHEWSLSFKRGLILTVVAVLLAVASNWLRIFIIVLVGNSTNMESILVKEHLVFGWIVYTLTMVPFFLLVFLFLRKHTTQPGHSTEKPFTETNKSHTETNRNALLVCMVLMFLPIAGNFLLKKIDHPYHFVFTQKLKANNNLRDPEHLSSWEPQFENADEILHLRFSQQSTTIDIVAVYYRNQARGKELINVNNYFYRESRWRQLASRELSVQIAGEEIKGQAEIIQRGLGDTRLLYYWYAHAERSSASTLQAKLDHLLSVLSGKGSSGAAYAILLPIDAGAREIRKSDIQEALLRLGI